MEIVALVIAIISVFIAAYGATMSTIIVNNWKMKNDYHRFTFNY